MRQYGEALAFPPNGRSKSAQGSMRPSAATTGWMHRMLSQAFRQGKRNRAEGRGGAASARGRAQRGPRIEADPGPGDGALTVRTARGR